MRATRAIIRLDNLKANIAATRAFLRPGVKVCLPVKANAYGHGAEEVSKAALEGKGAVDCLGVSNVDEGAALRKAGIPCPILLFSLPLPEELPALAEADLQPFVCDTEMAALLEKAAAKTGKTISVHLKIDTGMGRIGCRPEEAVRLAKEITASPHLRLAGTCTHLARSDEASPAGEEATLRQIERFKAALAAIRNAGIDPGIAHAGASGAVLRWPDSHFDMVRPGIMVYGYPPCPPRTGSGTLKPVMQFVTKIAFVKDVFPGEAVSYGGTWSAERKTRLATLPAGYGDGVPRALSNRFMVSIKGRHYPLSGRICMDQCLVDIGGQEAKRGEEAVIFGDKESGAAYDAADIASLTGTIPYEILCNIAPRVPRVYVREGA